VVRGRQLGDFVVIKLDGELFGESLSQIMLHQEDIVVLDLLELLEFKFFIA